MQYISKSKNTIAQFNDLNQGANKFSWYRCTLFAPTINLKYNCGIKLTLEDIKIIGEKQKSLGLLQDGFGGKGVGGVNAVYDYVIANATKRGWNIPNLAVFKAYDKKNIEDWLDRGYMATIGIGVNRTFVNDAKDGSLDLFEDYNKYKGTSLKHYTNITRWKCRFKEKCGDYNKEQIVDSYSWNKKGNKWIYKCDINKVLGTFAYNTRYIFY